MTKPTTEEVRQGTLDLLILKTLSPDLWDAAGAQLVLSLLLIADHNHRRRGFVLVLRQIVSSACARSRVHAGGGEQYDDAEDEQRFGEPGLVPS